MSTLAVVLAEERAHSFELSMVHRVLGTALDRRGKPAYDIRTCTPSGESVRSDAGFLIEPDGDLTMIADAKIVVVIPSPQHTALSAASGPGPLGPALAAVPATTQAMSICLASYVLAAAGLLDGRRATTHWVWTDDFARTFPAVTVDPAPLFVKDSNVTTSAGAAAGMDMLLDLIREDHGSEAANYVARRLVVPSWREGGQQQYIHRPLSDQSPAGDLSTTLDWAAEHLDQPLALDDLAQHAYMSRRTFTRVFRATTGTSPTQWLLTRRTELAKRLLETTDDTIDTIAHRTGFGSASSLRAHIRNCTGVSPAAYRNSFRPRD
ncbi:MAG: helix-turn-helix domain-containing protein [Nocardioides sp.]|uniref:GlxA family transcriptional regulator n=1 Tax=Nocardioides sp. TaxID=35761 RepID=UPI0039E41422